MPSYETIPAAVDGLTAPEPKTSLKRVLGAAALTSFVLGVVAATAVSSAVGPAHRAAQLNTDFDAAYITPNCPGLTSSHKHVKYFDSNPIGSGDAGAGWYCVDRKDEIALDSGINYYDDDHYCAIEFRCYFDDSASGFTFTLHDDC